MELKFSGDDYKKNRDFKRLSTQLEKILNLMIDGKYRTLRQIELLTGSPQSSISAQLRNLRKPSFGAYTVNKRFLKNGLYEYQVVK